MAERVSALAAVYKTGHFGAPDETGVRLREIRDLVLQQITAWPASLESVGEIAKQAAALTSAPRPGKVAASESAALLRVEPLKWWIFGAPAPTLDPEHGSTLDLSHALTQIRITGPQASALINRHLPLDLREHTFAVGNVAATAFHHVGVTLWLSEHGFELFLPRGFALSLWQMLVESAEQFGVEID